MNLGNLIKDKMGINKVMPKYIALDLGTSKTVLYVEGKGIIFNEATFIAYDKNGNILALGDEAKNLHGKSHAKIRIAQPLKAGTISDLQVVSDFINALMKKFRIETEWKNSVVLVACPKNVTKLERQLIQKICQNMGSKYVEVVEDILLGALGAGIDIFAPKGTLVLDLGGGKTSCGVVSAGDVIVSKTIRLGGIMIDEEIVKYVRSKYTTAIGLNTAEDIKHKIGNLNKHKENKKYKVTGRDVVTGLPKEVEVSEDEIHEILLSVAYNITELILNIIEDNVVEITVDIADKGILLIGGGSQIGGMKKFLEDYFKIPIVLPNNSATAVIDGCRAYESVIKNNVKLEANK